MAQGFTLPEGSGHIFPEYGRKTGYPEVMESTSCLMAGYPFLAVRSLGKSVLNREIPLFILGNEDAPLKILYVGAHHGMEWITSALLLRFIHEYCEYYREGRTIFGETMENRFKRCTLYIIPMLNPDGCDLAVHGLSDGHPLREQLLKMNDGKTDFSHWQANARGVDLNHNYDAGFEEYKKIEAERIIRPGPTLYSGEAPESEPESGALAAFLRFNPEIRWVMTLHSQGEEIYYTSGNSAAPRAKEIARILARLSSYRLAIPSGTAAYGGLTDWCIRTLQKPSCTVECGSGSNPLPIKDFFHIYMGIREMLFSGPLIS